MKRSKIVNDVVMVTREFGYAIFIAPLKNLEIQITDKVEEAEDWSSDYDQTKLIAHRAFTGYAGLQFEPKPAK